MAGSVTVRDVMTTDLAYMSDTANLVQAAKLMRDRDIGDVLVVDSEGMFEGIVTDRDIVVRALASGSDPKQTHLFNIVSEHCVTIGPDAPVSEAVRCMRDKALRRLPVTDDGHPIGIVTIGDLALHEDPTSALADISKAPSNR